MNESILTSIKKLLGIIEEYTQFDTDIIIHINTVFSILEQLGVRDDDPFVIHGSEETWKDYLQDETKLEIVKTFVYLKVKLFFDPPLNASVLNSYKSLADELEFRIIVNADPSDKEIEKDE